MDEPPSALLLVGNKVDLDDANQREVLTETGETFAKVSLMVTNGLVHREDNGLVY